VTDWQVVFLGIMAFALVVMALAQLAVAVALAKSARHVLGAVDELKREVRPLMAKVNRVADDANRVSALAVVQAERIDALIQQTSSRMDETFGILHSAVIEPVRQGTALLAAVRAGIAAIREWQSAQRRSSAAGRDDEDPLFVG
jgi:uncharacterized protein YoxC